MPPEFRKKIRSLDEILSAVGDRPRKKSVILCHGTFDIVHPGHLRHLLFAKERADLLVTSVTSDQFIRKGPDKPYVTEQLRASNLAALEFVDYVFIDDNATPIESIKKLRPDFFAKGYEYCDGKVHPKTQQEIEALEGYGGEMVFTPGDIVYSSTALQELHVPNLTLEQLQVLMEGENVSFDDLRKALIACRGLPVHILGDTIVDAYSHCTLLGASPKHPAFSVHHEYTHLYAGAAAVVARHLEQAGAKVTFTTLMGDDANKQFVLDELAKTSIRVNPVIDPGRPTTHKERFVVNNYRMLQVDRLDNRPVSEKQAQEFCRHLADQKAAAVVFSDFRHGIFTRTSISEFKRHIPEGAITAADSQVSNRWGNILEFVDFDLIAPNEREARFSLGDQDSVVRPLATELYRRARCKNLILKMGERGMLVCRTPQPLCRALYAVGSFVTRLEDPVGAGDALLAYATLALAGTGNILIASILGAAGAAVACERQGNVPVTAPEVEEKLASLEKRIGFG